MGYKNLTTEIDLQGQVYLVTGTYSPASMATYEQPPEDSDIEIETIVWCKKNEDGSVITFIDVTDLVESLENHEISLWERIAFETLKEIENE